MIQVADQHEADEYIRNTSLRNRVGQALSKVYPRTRWGVQCVGGVVQFWAEQISDEYGMVIHADRTSIDIEAEAIRKGGELLERFGVCRVKQDFSHVIRMINGKALGAAKGEQ